MRLPLGVGKNKNTYMVPGVKKNETEMSSKCHFRHGRFVPHCSSGQQGVDLARRRVGISDALYGLTAIVRRKYGDVSVSAGASLYHLVSPDLCRCGEADSGLTVSKTGGC